MLIMIKISEETYEATCNGRMLPPDVKNVVNAIKSGTPLPEGHWIAPPCVARTPFARQWKCSNCGEWAFKTAFCPNCMAKMQEVEE